MTEEALARIEETDRELGCFTSLLPGRAREAARRIDGRVRRGENPGPLAGVPVAAKNLFDVAGIPTVAGSKIRREQPPAAEDAEAVTRLEQAGAVIVGVTNMDEFAYGFTTENAHYGPTRNPHDPLRSAGGSSGGSAAAVAAGLVALSLGTDTNGSIRVPASFCGVFGLKPTFGRLSRRGVFPFVRELDHVGPFAASVRDLTLAYDVLQDPERQEAALPRLQEGVKDLRVARLGGWFEELVSDAARGAVDTVALALDADDRVEFEGVPEARAAAFCLTAASGAALHLSELQSRAQDFDPATRDRLLAGAMLPAAVVARARAMQHWFKRQVAEKLTAFDVLIAPATPCVAPFLGQTTLRVSGRDMPLRPNLGLLTQPISFAGLPVVAVPVNQGGSLPVGVQVIARAGDEVTALRVAWWLEQNRVARHAAK